VKNKEKAVRQSPVKQARENKERRWVSLPASFWRELDGIGKDYIVPAVGHRVAAEIIINHLSNRRKKK